MIARGWIVLALAVAGCDRSEPPSRDGAPAAVKADRQPAANEAASVPSGNVSRFTTNVVGKCRLVEKNEEEGGYYRHHCPGIGDYSYELVESDLRQSLVIIGPDGRRDEVSPGGATGSGGFSTLGTTFEWRGPTGAAPRTATVRYNVNEDPEAKVPPRSYLVVIRLSAPACVVGVVPPGPGQNDKARAIADRLPLPACLPGQ